MRRTTFFLSLTLFVGTVGIAAACSEQQPASPTAPAAQTAGITTSQVVTSSQVSPAAKPIPAPAGFTKVTTVEVGPIMVPAGNPGGGQATCPAGTTVVSGGYDFTGYSVANPPWVKTSRAFGDAWIVNVLSQAGATFYVYANCAS